jgi:choice-of-anchor A domain-containing protein/LPXTG-motif cell wall-anchored protein
MRKKLIILSLIMIILSVQFISLNTYALTYQLNQFIETSSSISIASSFNLFVFDNLAVQNSDVEGRMAVGGTLKMSNYSVGSKINTSSSRGDLVVGGSIYCENGQVFSGNTVIGNNSKIEKYKFNNVCGIMNKGKKSSQPVVVEQYDVKSFFEKSKIEFKSFSKKFKSLKINGNVKIENNYMILSGSSSSMNIFEINANRICNSNSSLEKLSGIKINVPSKSACIINVCGNNFGFGDYQIDLNGLEAEDVLWNFCGVENAFLCNLSLKGTVFSPETKWILKGNGNIDGSFIAHSINSKNGSSYEYHHHSFKHFDKLNGCIPVETTKPPITVTDNVSNPPTSTTEVTSSPTNSFTTTGSPDATPTVEKTSTAVATTDPSSLPKTGEGSASILYIVSTFVIGLGLLLYKKF